MDQWAGLRGRCPCGPVHGAGNRRTHVKWFVFGRVRDGILIGNLDVDVMIPTEPSFTLPAETMTARPRRWRYSPRETAVRLFFTCWLVFVLHLATNTVREIYLALAIGDHLSFRVDEYANMHPDLFEKPGFGWHIGANPGASMLGAIPYAVLRPLVDRIVSSVNLKRARSGKSEPPSYHSWPMAGDFYKEAWRRGYDIKFGLAAIIMQAACMAPISALAVVVMFLLLRRLFGSDRTAFWLALLYAFGTPVFYRTGYLNHNLMLGHFVFFGFHPSERTPAPGNAVGKQAQ